MAPPLTPDEIREVEPRLRAAFAKPADTSIPHGIYVLETPDGRGEWIAWLEDGSVYRMDQPARGFRPDAVAPGMTPEAMAAAVVKNATGPINVRRYACDSLEVEIAKVIREERERCAQIAESLFVEPWGLAPTDVRKCIAQEIRGQRS